MNIKSMTGFGKAEATAGSKKITVEIRSLNSKQLDLSVKAPAVYRSLDPEIRAIAGKALMRGKADVFVNVESLSENAGAVIDKELFSSYYRQLLDIAAAEDMDFAGGPAQAQLMASILRLPEVVNNNNTQDITEEESAAVIDALRKALAKADDFRIGEGSALIADILHRVGLIESAVYDIEPFEKERVDTVRTRIREGLEKIGTTVDENRLEQEMIFYIEKLDITEEKVRLRNHCAYFREAVAGEEAPGRKLGFIAQEMGREINTLGSKANNADIQRIVIGMKDELEKIKEQLLNIL